MGRMPRMAFSLTEEEIEKLKAISKKEKRPYSRQVAYMLDFYLEHKEKEKTEG